MQPLAGPWQIFFPCARFTPTAAFLHGVSAGRLRHCWQTLLADINWKSLCCYWWQQRMMKGPHVMCCIDRVLPSSALSVLLISCATLYVVNYPSSLRACFTVTSSTCQLEPGTVLRRMTGIITLYCILRGEKKQTNKYLFDVLTKGSYVFHVFLP